MDGLFGVDSHTLTHMKGKKIKRKEHDQNRSDTKRISLKNKKKTSAKFWGSAVMRVSVINTRRFH